MSYSVIFRSGKLRQKVEFTQDEIIKCPFIKKSFDQAKHVCPKNHHVLPVTIRVTSLSISTIGNFLCFMKNIPLQNLTQEDVFDLSVMAYAFEMEDLAEQLLTWKPMEPKMERTTLVKHKKQHNTNRPTTEYTEFNLIDEGNILLQKLAKLNL
jgi:hypothetical protein